MILSAQTTPVLLHSLLNLSIRRLSGQPSRVVLIRWCQKLKNVFVKKFDDFCLMLPEGMNYSIVYNFRAVVLNLLEL